MTEKNKAVTDSGKAESPPEHYYDYEARFIKQTREQERIAILPRVIKPAMFAKGEFALGDMRVFSRYTVAPLSMLTCGFLELAPGAETQFRLMIPSLTAYIIRGSGECVQNGSKFSFDEADVVVVPPYTECQFVASAEGFRAWLPQIRLWHEQGLLWRAANTAENGVHEIEEVDRRTAAVFEARRRVTDPAPGGTRYDWFLSRLAEENRIEKQSPRVIRGSERPWERTRQGMVKFYISRWSETASPGLDIMAQEIKPGERSGEHRHIFEELILVIAGRGYDLHDGTRHSWEGGDVICIPPMIVHQHVNDGDTPAHLVSVWPQQPGHELLGGIEQISDASGWNS
jgi:quercetin dioxygenase-like cupin family protein